MMDRTNKTLRTKIQSRG